MAKNYTSEITQFLNDYKTRHPETELRQREGRSRLWDKQLDPELQDGFGPDAGGEDRLDSVLGLLCALAVVEGRRPDFIPDDPWVRRWEGWVLGQTALPVSQ